MQEMMKIFPFLAIEEKGIKEEGIEIHKILKLAFEIEPKILELETKKKFQRFCNGNEDYV